MATHLFAVACKLSRFLPVRLTLAPSLEQKSKLVIENQKGENKDL